MYVNLTNHPHIYHSIHSLFEMSDYLFAFQNPSLTETNNTRVFSVTVVGKTPSQSRTRINFRRKSFSKSKPIFYNPSRRAKNEWSLALKNILAEYNISSPIFSSNPYTDHPLHLEVQIYLPIPKTDLDKQQHIKPKHHLWPNTKDIDNMLKFIMDAMQDFVYKNDACICSINCKKQFADVGDVASIKEPYTSITVIQTIL